jgi:hypothetical protein
MVEQELVVELEQNLFQQLQLDAKWMMMIRSYI